ncbi:MAG: hypothetical protein ACOC93_04720, partial [Planctomycetota bacterium]
AELIDTEIRELVDRAYQETREMVEDNRDRFQRVAEALIKYETLSAEEVQAIIDGQPLDKPTVNELIDRESARSQPAEQADKKHADQTEGDQREEPGSGAVPEPS